MDDRGIDQRAFAHEQAAFFQMAVDRLEERGAEVILLQQAAELEQRRRVGNRVGGETDSQESTHRLTVIDGVFQRFIGQAIPLLQEIQPEHPLHSHRRASASPGRIMRTENLQQLVPRHNLLHLREKSLPAGRPAFQ